MSIILILHRRCSKIRLTFISKCPNFGVDKDGILFRKCGSKVDTPSKGLIGGFTIGSSSLFSTNIFISGSQKVELMTQKICSSVHRTLMLNKMVVYWFSSSF